MSGNLAATLDTLARRLFGRTMAEAHAANICLRCGDRVRPDELTTEDATEYMLSGFCPGCFTVATATDD